ncbi:MAG TPA: glycosyltransferase family 4 protein [Gemmatirosa sp.]|nr:glycosyltransferase family 4 protein [Gemmatirosa sp.]
MRALFYHPSAEWNGRARVFLAAARGLAAQGWNVTFATAPEGEPRRRVLAAGLPAVGVDPDAGMVSRSGELAAALRDHFVEVVFVHGERDQLAASTAVWRASRGAVVRRVGAGDALALGRSVRLAMGRVATGFLFSSPEQVRDAGALADAAAGNGAGNGAGSALGTALGSVVADLGIAPGAPAGALPDMLDGEPPAAHSIVCVHEPGAHRATQTVLRATALLAPRHPGLRVHLVGPGAADEGLRLHAAALGVTRAVIAGGPEVDAAPLLADADLAWVVAGGDDGALGALDAMAARVPVLVPRGGTAARYVPDGITGVHLEPDDVPGTAAVIARLLAAHEARATMGAAGQARVVRDHGEAAMLDGFSRAASGARDRTRWRA